MQKHLYKGETGDEENFAPQNILPVHVEQFPECTKSKVNQDAAEYII
jgi:hypothetical protein